jgi:hypothetical protein
MSEKKIVMSLLPGGVAFFAAAIAVPASAAGVSPVFNGVTGQDVGVMDRARPDYDAKGVDVGSFVFFPTFDLTGSYDDNVFRRPDAKSDFFLTLAPAARLQSQWGRHFLEFYTGLAHYQYVRDTGGNITDWKVGVDGRYDISHAAMLAANVYAGEFHELWSEPNNLDTDQAAPNRYLQTHADASWLYQPARIGLELGGSFDRKDWLNTPLIGGGFIGNDDRNENEYQGYAKVFYDFSPGYIGFVRASYDARRFDKEYDRDGYHRDSEGFRVDGGLDMQITHLLSGEISAGYLKQNFSQDVPKPLSGISGLNYGARLDWYATPALTVHLEGKRELEDVIIDGASVADNKSVSLSADYEFRRDVILQGYVSYIDSKLTGISRTDRYPGAGITVKYLINRHISAYLSYNYNRRSTDAAYYRYTDNMVSLGLALHI